MSSTQGKQPTKHEDPTRTVPRREPPTMAGILRFLRARNQRQRTQMASTAPRG